MGKFNGKVAVITGGTSGIVLATAKRFWAPCRGHARGTLITVQKALPLFNDRRSVFLTGPVASIEGFPSFGVYAASKAAVHAFARAELDERAS